MIRECNMCEEIKDINEFQLRKDSGKYRTTCKECYSLYKLSFYYASQEYNLEIKKQYREDPKNKAHRRKWDKLKRKSNPNHKLRINLRNRINKAIERNQKAGSAIKDLGCSIEELKQYLEKQFYDNLETNEQMTWNNWSRIGWHIDHIIPLSSFDLANKEQFKQACHYTNLQPMWAEENIKKGGIKK